MAKLWLIPFLGLLCSGLFAEESDVGLSRRSMMRLGLGLGVPSFSKLRYFDKLYDKVSASLELKVDYNIFEGSFYSLAGGLRVTQYTSEGKRAMTPLVSNPAASEIQLKSGTKSIFSMLPYQFVLSGRMSLLPERLLVVNSWVGYEESYWEEVRFFEEAAESGKTPFTSGFSNGFVVGASFDVKISQFDEQSALSMYKTLGFRSIYIPPYVQTAIHIGSRGLISGARASKLNLSRLEYGFRFSFES